MKKSQIQKIIREEFVNILREETLITEAFQDPIARMLAKDRNLENNWFKFFNAMSNSFDIAWDKVPKGSFQKVQPGSPLAKKGLAIYYIKDDIENAFNKELKKILATIDEKEIPSNYSSFYFDNLKEETLKEKNIKINNKIIHQSKLLNYFEKKYDINKVDEDLNKLLKSIKKNKDYKVSTKDLILLESLTSDGVKISKKYQNMFEFNQSRIPTDIQLLLNNNELGMILLRLVEIIGEDDLKSLDSDSLYFIISILNQLNLDSIRNKILLEVLPLKI